MPLASGGRIGGYEIVSLIGAGGMGEVYRARDMALGRDVAIKVLPDALSHDPERLARFEREAKTLASLNHPHVAQIHGLVREGNTIALVMEFVDGDDLAMRLGRGPLPADEALPIARQIADGLAFAHDRSIIHRDLKPANIKVTPDGAVKILDFGLAKAVDAEQQGPDGAVTNSPTITSPAMTARGVILGTAAYMSPEQARGRPVDRRTDVWAFGCVLYEMLTGTRLFKGEDVTETIVSVMTKEPSWEALPPSMPRAARTLLRRCLQKDRSRRLSDMHDVRLEIDEVIAGGGDEQPASVPSSPSVQARSWRWALPAAVVGAAVMLALPYSGLLPWPGRGASRPLRVSIVHNEGGEVGVPAISPDGTRVAYRARREDGLPVLWVRDLATGESRALPGTEDAYYPFWSPDSRHLGFAAGYALKRVPSAGGQVQVITRTSGLGVSASWAADGTVVYGPSDTSPLHRVPAEGGTPTVITTLQGNDWSHRYPWLLPDGRRFLFTAVQYTMAAEASASGVYLGSLDGAVPTRILGDLSNAVYASPGYILFSRAGVLTAAPFDLPSGRVVGEAFTLGEPVAFDGATNLAGLSAAADGTVAVRPPPALLTLGAAVATELRVVDRRGATLAASAPALYSHRMAMHPGGRTIAVQMTDERTGTNDLHQVNLLTGERAPLTSTNAWAGRPVWSADGSQLAYANQPVGLADDLYIKDLRTGSDEPIIQSKMNFEQPAAWSHDGRHLVFYRIRNDGASLHTFTLSSKTETPFAVMRPGIQVAFSPDDRYLAVTSFDSGQVETIVKSFPDGRQSWPLTSSGGWPISWHTNGREILVATLSGEIVAYSVSTAGGQFSAGQPEVLVRNVGMSAQHAVATADHSRIVIRVDPQAARDKGEIRLLFGWTRP